MAGTTKGRCIIWSYVSRVRLCQWKDAAKGFGDRLYGYSKAMLAWYDTYYWCIAQVWLLWVCICKTPSLSLDDWAYPCPYRCGPVVVMHNTASLSFLVNSKLHFSYPSPTLPFSLYPPQLCQRRLPFIVCNVLPSMDQTPPPQPALQSSRNFDLSYPTSNTPLQAKQKLAERLQTNPKIPKTQNPTKYS